MKKLAVVIPAYNEEASIAGVVNDVLTSAANEFVSIVPVVVDDGSHDATSAKAAETSCVLLKLPCNLGIGGAVQTGFRYAFENNFDYAMQLDGDGQHPATEISKFFDYLQLHPHTDVVIGSRYIVKTGFQSSAMRRMGINMIKLIIRLI
ncbi:MAG TPA: glycosyltransferase family 2 protein, partial [Bacteroidales bacterium]|nr:glycosyltransferase family 2 protein [Bacteroidales bacterium]